MNPPLIEERVTVRQRLLTTTDSIILVRHGYGNLYVPCPVRPSEQGRPNDFGLST